LDLRKFPVSPVAAAWLTAKPVGPTSSSTNWRVSCDELVVERAPQAARYMELGHGKEMG